MSKSIKILITVITLIMAIIGVDCIVGFTIGGKVKLIHIIIFVIAALLMSALSIVFINGKGYIKSSGYREALILISIGILIASYLMYGCLNYIGAENESVTYDTVVEYSVQTKTIYGMDIGFKDRDGNLCETKDYTQIWFDDTYPDEDVPITIKETQGGFGYPIYEITAVNGMPER